MPTNRNADSHPNPRGRACLGHPRLTCFSGLKTWVPGTRPGTGLKCAPAFKRLVHGKPVGRPRLGRARLRGQRRADQMAAVTRALEEFIARRRQKRLLELMGKLEWDEGFDYKVERTRL